METIDERIERLEKELQQVKAMRKAECRMLPICEGEKFYYKNTVDGVSHAIWRNDGDSARVYKRKTGNMYFTKWEAEREKRHDDFRDEVATMFRVLNNGIYYPKIREDNWRIHINADGPDGAVYPTYQAVMFSKGQRGWWSPDKQVVKQVIAHFGDQKFIDWALGKL